MRCPVSWASAPRVSAAKVSTIRGATRSLLDRMREVPEAGRGARYLCVLAYLKPDGWFGFFEGALHGRILRAPQGEGGFGYDPLMYLPEHGCAVSELPLDGEKTESATGESRSRSSARGWPARASDGA